jgi:hypothetical protein
MCRCHLTYSIKTPLPKDVGGFVPYRESKNGAMDVPKAGGFYYSSFAASRRVPERQEADEIVMLSHGFFLRRKNSLVGFPEKWAQACVNCFGEAHIVQNSSQDSPRRWHAECCKI